MDMDRMRSFEKKSPIDRGHEIKKLIKSFDLSGSCLEIDLIPDSAPEIRAGDREKIPFEEDGFIARFYDFSLDTFDFFFENRFESEWTGGKDSHENDK